MTTENHQEAGLVRPMSPATLAGEEEADRRWRKVALPALAMMVATVIGVTVRAAAGTHPVGMVMLLAVSLAVAVPLALGLHRRRSARAAPQPGDLWRGRGMLGIQPGTMILRPGRLCWEPFDLWRGPLPAGRWEIPVADLASVEIGRPRWGGLGQLRPPTCASTSATATPSMCA